MAYYNTILSPTNFFAVDASKTWTVTWKFSAPETFSSAPSWDFWRRALPSGTIEYYNASLGTWVGSAPGNSGTLLSGNRVDGYSFTFPAGKFTANTTYQYAVGAWFTGPLGLSSYTTTQILVCPNNPPLLLIGTSGGNLSPANSVTTTRPTISWQYSPGNTPAINQVAYLVTVHNGFEADPFSAAGLARAFWASNNGQWTYDSLAQSIAVGADIQPGNTYYYNVRILGTGNMIVDASGGFSANWFVLTGAQPTAPLASATYNSSTGIVSFNATSALNLLNSLDSLVNWSAGSTWSNQSNTQPVTYTGTTDGQRLDVTGETYAQALTQYGTYSAWTSAKATYTNAIQNPDPAFPTAMRFGTPTGTSGYPVIAGQTYTALISMRWDAGSGAAPSPYIGINWYNSSGTIIGQSNGTATALNTATHTQLTVSAAAPAGAVYAAIYCNVPFNAFGNTVYVKQASFALGTSTSWTQGGATSFSWIVERSIDGGTTWAEVDGYGRTNQSKITGTATQTPAIADADRMAPLGLTGVQYRFSVATDIDNAAATLGKDKLYSGMTTVSVDTTPGTSWWLRDPLRKLTDVQLKQYRASFTKTQGGDSYRIPGRSAAVVVQSLEPISDEFDIQCWVTSLTEYNNLVALLESRKTLGIQNDNGGLTWYVRVLGQLQFDRQQAAGTGNQNKVMYSVRARVIEVVRPSIQSTLNTDTSALTFAEVA